MTIELHTWNTPNGRKISVALEEMGLPYKVFPVNISKGEQMAPEFLAISPNNKIPAIVDPDGPGGKRVSVFESGAILLYLGEKTGKFLPSPLIERIPVYEWLMWQMGGFGPMPGQVHHFIALENEADRAYGLKRYMAETRRLYGVLDRRLAAHEFVAGPLSVADFAILGLAAPAPQGGAQGFPPCRTLVQRADGAARGEARHGSKAGLSFLSSPRSCGER
jgi:GST-like protein